METQTVRTASFFAQLTALAEPKRRETSLVSPQAASQLLAPTNRPAAHAHPGPAAATRAGGNSRTPDAGPAVENSPGDDSPKLLAEWLDKTLSDVEAESLSQQQTCLQLRSQWHVQASGVMQACVDLENSLDQLDFGLLRPPGWIARLTGRRRHASLQFVKRWHRIKTDERRFNVASLAFVQKYMTREAAVKKTLLTLEMDSRRSRETLHLARRCLEALSFTLGETLHGDAALLQLANRAERRLARLSRLNAAIVGAPESLRHSAKRGNALIELMQWRWVAVYSGWQASMRTLEEQIDSRMLTDAPAGERLKGHARLRRLIRYVRASCAAYQRQEEHLLEGLAALDGKPAPGS